jgi:hypothetical protein
MSTTPETIVVPPPAEIRQRLLAARNEARALRRLLKLSEAAYQAKEASEAHKHAGKEGGHRDA